MGGKLLLNFGVKFLCSARVSLCYEWRCQGIERRFRKSKHTKKYITKDSTMYFVETFWKFSVRACEVVDR